MIDVKITTRPKSATAGRASAGRLYTARGTVAGAADTVAYANEAGHAREADEALTAARATEAVHAASAATLDDDSPILGRYLKRTEEDTALELITFLKGLETGNYIPETSGGFLGTDAASGDSMLEVARLYVRVKAYFEELTVIKAGVLAGRQYITPGGGIKCVRVIEKGMVDIHRPVTLEQGGELLLENGGKIISEKAEPADNGVPEGVYRCLFVSEQDGEMTECKFVKGDFAIAEVFNARAGTSNKISNHRYWRLVTEVNNDAYEINGVRYGYIDLSKTECEDGSDAPQAGDEICQLGNAGDEKERQTAMVFSTVGTDAPSIKLYAGINSFSLENRAVVTMGRSPMTGKVYFRLGIDGAAQYLEYNQDSGLEVAGAISSKSTIGGKGVGEYISEVVKGEGAVIADQKIEYAVATQGYVPPAEGWGTEFPQVPAGQFLWTRTTMTYSDGKKSVAYSVSRVGTNGLGYAPNLISGKDFTVDASASTSGYTYRSFPLERRVYAAGEKFAVSVEGIENLAGNATRYYVSLFKRAESGNGVVGAGLLSANKRDAVLTVGSEVPASAGLFLYIYAGYPGETAGNKVRYTHLMLCQGDTPRAWVPSASEMEAAAIVSQSVTYAVSTQGDQPADAAFIHTAPPVMRQGWYLWTKTVVTYSDGTVIKSYNVGRTGSDGPEGLPGAPGADGRTSYLHLAYASEITGTLPSPSYVTGFSTTAFAGARYIGVYTDFTADDSEDHTKYKWSEWGASEGGGVNLLRNTDFLDGLQWWEKNADVTLDTDYTLDGRPSAHLFYDGNTNDYRLFLHQKTEVDRQWVGKIFTLSAFILYDSSTMTAIDRGANMEIRFLDSAGSRISAVYCPLPTEGDGQWRRITASGVCPANAAYIDAFVIAQNNGEFLVNGMKLELGSVASLWSPAPLDASYLRAALRESSVYEGGLILATLLRLGYTADNGQYRVMAGVNGAANVTGPRDIAFWAGGEAVDAANHGADAPATFVVRHDGTAYACGNTVRFEANRIEIGEALELNQRGLFLKGADGAVRLKVTNEEVWDGVDGTSSFKEYSQNLGSQITIGLAGGGSTGGISVRPQHYVKTAVSFPAYTFSGTLSAGSTVTGVVSLSFSLTGNFGDFANFPLSATATAEIQRRSGASWVTIYTQEGAFSASDKRCTCSISINALLSVEGTYRLLVRVPSTKGGTGDPTQTVNITGSVTGKVILGVDEQTVVGNNGIMTIWNGLKFVASRKDGKGYFGALVGKYGLRITPDKGFEKTTDGEHWVSANL